jgi:hypothetical protein
MFKYVELMRFQVLTATSMKMTVFWDVAPCSLVATDRRFRGVHCLHHQGDEYKVHHYRRQASSCLVIDNKIEYCVVILMLLLCRMKGAQLRCLVAIYR